MRNVLPQSNVRLQTYNCQIQGNVTLCFTLLDNKSSFFIAVNKIDDDEYNKQTKIHYEI